MFQVSSAGRHWLLESQCPNAPLDQQQHWWASHQWHPAHLGHGKVVKTPHLELAYAPRDFRAYREMGATWQIITDDLQQPKGIEPVGINAANRK